jgi:hypothetical protein
MHQLEDCMVWLWPQMKGQNGLQLKGVLLRTLGGRVSEADRILPTNPISSPGIPL